MTDTNNNTEVTPEQMKQQALLQRIAELTADYENKVADLRVAYTVVSDQLEKAQAKIDEYEAPVDAAE